VPATLISRPVEKSSHPAAHVEAPSRKTSGHERRKIFAEYTRHPTAAATGPQIHHTFAARLVAKSARIKLVMESLNVVAVAQALLPGGTANLSPPTEKIFSIHPNIADDRSPSWRSL
jgi:hypothetical protein